MKRVKSTMTTDNDCPICFESLTEDVRIALPCGHRFHEEYIRRSLTSTRGKCPNCRATITNIFYYIILIFKLFYLVFSLCLDLFLCSLYRFDSVS
jgi:hypothetical protein